MPGGPGTAPIPGSCWTTGWSACFASAMTLETCRMKIALPNDLANTAEVDLNLGDDGYFLRARLNVSLPGIEPESAKALIDGAHQTCPYSKVTRGNIEVAITVI
jgi:lipoyl-dependent peroxiredoxin